MNRQLLQVNDFLTSIAQPPPTFPQDRVTKELLIERTLQRSQAENKFLAAFTTGRDSVDVDQTQALSGLASRLYVLLADAHILGLSYLLPVAFQMLHEANMRKIWTAEQMMTSQNKAASFEPVPNDCFIAKDFAGFLVNPPTYEPPHYSDLFESLAGQELLDFEHAIGLHYGEDFLDEELSPEPGYVSEDDFAEAQSRYSDSDLDTISESDNDSNNEEEE